MKRLTLVRTPLLAAALALCGCSVVNIQAGTRDEVEVVRGFGMINVQLSPKTRTVVMESTTLGVINSFEGLAAGYHNAMVAASAEGHCGIVLWIRTNEELERLQELLKVHGSEVCVSRQKNIRKE